MFDQVVKLHDDGVKVIGSNPVKTIVYFSKLGNGSFIISSTYQKCSLNIKVIDTY